MRLYFTRRVLQEGMVQLRYVPADHMPVDFLAKELAGPKYTICRARSSSLIETHKNELYVSYQLKSFVNEFNGNNWKFVKDLLQLCV